MLVISHYYMERTDLFPQRRTADIDLGTITDRMAVRKAVQCGQVEDAIEKVNDLNPEVRTFLSDPDFLAIYFKCGNDSGTQELFRIS